jgi:hypothetical protein
MEEMEVMELRLFSLGEMGAMEGTALMVEMEVMAATVDRNKRDIFLKTHVSSFTLVVLLF